MDIAVLIKQVPDTDEVKMDPEKGTMVRDGVGSIINPLDLNALQEALKLKEETKGTVTAISMGPPQAEEALREALALGADRTLLVTDRLFAGGDTWATARTLAATIEKAGPFDLVLAGEKATDGETGQVGPEVAVMMDIPFSTYISAVELDGSRVKVRRTVEEGIQVQSLPTPCLFTVLHDLNEPGMPTLAGKMRARRSEVERMTLGNLDLPEEETGLRGSPTRVVKIDRPQLTRSTESFSGNDLEKGLDRVVEILRAKALL
jgi:electron transfer flavoprotein beta subunit